MSHIPKYHEALVKARGLLNDGGMVVIEEPNDYNELQMQVAKEKGFYWLTDDHVNYFSFNSLQSKVESLGFEKVYRSCTYPMELFYLMGYDYIGDEEVGRRVHKLRYNMLSKMTYQQRKMMKEMFAKKGWGRDLLLMFRKFQFLD